MQLKPKMNYHIIPVRMVIMIKKRITNADEDKRKGNCHTWLVGMSTVHPLWIKYGGSSEN
jgi:hypothetical protein